MTLAISLVALGVLMLLAGGPAEFMLASERALQGVAETVYEFWLSVR